jgi:O-antigen/teichoic acid export membrane protein
MALTIGLGITRPWFQTTFSAGVALMSIPIFFWFIPRLGIVGAALGLAIPNVMLCPIYLVKINRILGVGNKQFLATVIIRPLVSALLTSGVSWILMRPWAHSILGLVTGGTGCLVLFYLLLLLVGGISREDKETFRIAVLGRVRGSMRVAS